MSGVGDRVSLIFCLPTSLTRLNANVPSTPKGGGFIGNYGAITTLMPITAMTKNKPSQTKLGHVPALANW